MPGARPAARSSPATLGMCPLGRRRDRGGGGKQALHRSRICHQNGERDRAGEAGSGEHGRATCVIDMIVSHVMNLSSHSGRAAEREGAGMRGKR